MRQCQDIKQVEVQNACSLAKTQTVLKATEQTVGTHAAVEEILAMLSQVNTGK